MPKHWYVLRVQSNKEDIVRDTLEKKAKLEGLQEIILQAVVPTERVSSMKGGRRRMNERKLYPGYVFLELDVDENGRVPEKAWFAIREISGVGDFIGTEGKPIPMKPHEVEKLVGEAERSQEEAPTIRIDLSKGDTVKIKEGPFENFDGTVDDVNPEKGLVRVIVTIFGRLTPVELEYWQVEEI
ncbi:MAG: transcription termination/antitermination protein NusG [Planctomycetia bacterium]|nr:transcription termination/antitermination protein NusG [Planctomycetia bacterium]